MLIAPRQYKPGTVLHADICIIGSGAAAISMALRLADTNLKIIMLTGGSWNETSKNRSLHKGVVDPSNSHEPLEENRRRAFGGATGIWGGRCVPFDPIDFEKRPWIPHSGWPISYDDVAPYYADALKLCEAGENNFDARESFPATPSEIIDGLDFDDIVSFKLEKWSPPTRFALRYKKELEESKDISVYLDAHVTSLEVENKACEISGVSLVIQSSHLSVKAGKYVLATGGIENPRLLLASTSTFYPTGVGNTNDNVGRYYMSHLMGTYGAINPKERKKLILHFELDGQGALCRRRWWFTDQMQRKNHIGNAIMFLSRSMDLRENADPVHSARFVSQSIAGIFKKNYRRSKNPKDKDPNKSLRRHLRVIARNSHDLITHMIRTGMRKFQNRRIPFSLPSIKSKWLSVYFQTEHLPNPESRILLSKEKDALGLPLPVVRIAFCSLDMETVLTAYKTFFERVRLIGGISVNLNMPGLRKFIYTKMHYFNSGAHHMGTTRMSEDPSQGVVDSNCKVHGVGNLYIAGSSVFPTSGHANPTLTLVALSVRLADHLKKND